VAKTVAEAAAQVGLTPLLDAPLDAVSYSARRQLEVGVALATRPRALLMDEPTSGVGPKMIGRLHRLLRGLPRDPAVVIIEHDMDLAFDVADSVTVLNYGQVVFDGDPEAARRSALLKEIYLGSWGDA
jgi:ABC-type branched-subunit amino acid transport system ATPase component